MSNQELLKNIHPHSFCCNFDIVSQTCSLTQTSESDRKNDFKIFSGTIVSKFFLDNFFKNSQNFQKFRGFFRIYRCFRAENFLSWTYLARPVPFLRGNTYRSSEKLVYKADDKEVQDVDDAEEDAILNESETQKKLKLPGMETTDPRRV